MKQKFVLPVFTVLMISHFSDRNVQHNVSYTIFQNNTEGAIYYGSAGEISPTVTIERNRIEDNCLKFYGNFTSCKSPVLFDVQNMQHIYFRVSRQKLLEKSKNLTANNTQNIKMPMVPPLQLFKFQMICDSICNFV